MTHINKPHALRGLIFASVTLFSVLLLAAVPAWAQQKSTGTTPSADKVVAAYLKAIGGKKRVASVRQASERWTISGGGTGVTSYKAPGLFKLALSMPTEGF